MVTLRPVRRDGRCVSTSGPVNPGHPVWWRRETTRNPVSESRTGRLGRTRVKEGVGGFPEQKEPSTLVLVRSGEFTAVVEPTVGLGCHGTEGAGVVPGVEVDLGPAEGVAETIRTSRDGLLITPLWIPVSGYRRGRKISLSPGFYRNR